MVPPARMKPRRSEPAFVYRAGIGLGGTPITCDGIGSASDLIFLSHARALSLRAASQLSGARASRRQIVTTETTLRLLGDAGEKLRDRTLPAAFGRPFNLGNERIEVVPTGYLPGSAGLLSENDGHSAFYLGAYAPEALAPDFPASEVRRADAVCIDATFGDPALVIPPRQQTIAEIVAFAKAALAEKQTPVLLGSPFGALAAVASALFHASLPLRAHSRITAVLSRLRPYQPSLPTPARFSGRVAEGEVLLWPSEARDAVALSALERLRFALVSGAAAHPEALSRMRVERGFALTVLPTAAEIQATIAATGAKEVALFHDGAEPLAKQLLDQGLFAYTLEPPLQMTLPGA
jgi:hypothetical protein